MLRRSVLTLILCSLPAFAQTETIDNRTVIEMSRAGLSQEIILKKISSSNSAFDISAPGLITLKTAGVDEAVIAALMERSEQPRPAVMSDPARGSFSEIGNEEIGITHDIL